MSDALTTLPNQDEIDSMMTLDADTSAAMYGSLMQNVNIAAEVKISRFQIVQPQSPELQMKGYTAGQIMDATGKAIRSRRMRQPWLDGKVEESERDMVECLPYLIVGKLPTEATRWTPKAQRDLDPTLPRIEWKTTDLTERRVLDGVYQQWGGTWGAKNRPDTHKLPPAVTISQNFFVLPLTPQYDVDGAFRILSCSRTSAPMGGWLSTHMTERGTMSQVPWFYVQWMYTKMKPGKNNSTFFTLNSVCGVQLRQTTHAAKIHKLCQDMFKTLFMNGEKNCDGKAMQLNMLNVVDDADDVDVHETQGDDSNTVAAGAQTASAPTGEPSGDEF